MKISSNLNDFQNFLENFIEIWKTLSFLPERYDFAYKIVRFLGLADVTSGRKQSEQRKWRDCRGGMILWRRCSKRKTLRRIPSNRWTFIISYGLIYLHIILYTPLCLFWQNFSPKFLSLMPFFLAKITNFVQIRNFVPKMPFLLGNPRKCSNVVFYKIYRL